MNDRELLEQAAKAYGIAGHYSEIHDGFYTVGDYLWNPLTDDGDALRLAVKLEIDVDHMLGEVATICTNLKNMDFVYEDYRDDPYAATRRAIVRAAAEIGKDMK